MKFTWSEKFWQHFSMVRLKCYLDLWTSLKNVQKLILKYLYWSLNHKEKSKITDLTCSKNPLSISKTRKNTQVSITVFITCFFLSKFTASIHFWISFDNIDNYLLLFLYHFFGITRILHFCYLYLTPFSESKFL